MTVPEKFKSDFHTTHILIVDDVVENIQLLGHILRNAGYKIAIASSGKQALESISCSLPDIILLDIMMPEMDGFEVCSTLKNDPLTADIPVVFLTAKVDSEDIVKGFLMGAVDYITKPYKSDEVLARIATHLELYYSRKMIRQQHAMLAELNIEKDRLFRIMASVLKTPFSSFTGLLKLFSEGTASFEEKERSEAIKTMLKASENLSFLIGELLFWAELKNGTKSLSPSLFDPGEAADEGLISLSAAAQNKGLSIVSEIGRGNTVFCDIDLFMHTISSLMINVMDYAAGGESLSISMAKKDCFIELSVIIPVAGTLIEDILWLLKMEAAEAVSVTLSRRSKGLGLILCREFIRLNGGEITVENEHGRGTAVRFTVPVAETEL